ncbi:MAG: hypothetical protein BIFFINMI_03619 [Phycisphaerae bacterium]|nr:hypothetical protein [Phycisphaerae bacterium]
MAPRCPGPVRRPGEILAPALLFLLACVGLLRADDGLPLALPGLPDAETPHDLVKAELLADTRTVAPGRPFRVGVLLRMKPGWHVYWRNPGDAGLATTVRFDLPSGFVASPLQWPIPERYELPGDIVDYGYSGQVLLLADVTPPTKLDGETVKLAARVDWLSCNEKCVPGGATLSLTLAVGQAAQPDHAELFATWAGRLPTAGGAADCPVSVEVEGVVARQAAPQAIRVTLKWNKECDAAAAVDLRCYPAPPDGCAVENLKVTPQPGRVEVSLTVRRLTGIRADGSPVALLVSWGPKDGRRGIQVELPVSGDPEARAPPQSGGTTRPDDE